MEESNRWGKDCCAAGKLSQCVFCTHYVRSLCCYSFYTPAIGSEVSVPGDAGRTYLTLEVIELSLLHPIHSGSRSCIHLRSGNKVLRCHLLVEGTWKT